MEIRLKLELKLEQKLELKLEQELVRLLERKQGRVPDQRIALLQDPILLTGAIPDQRTEAKQVLMYPLEQILARTTELNQEQIVVQNREPIIPTAMLPILRCIQKMEPVIIPRAIAIPAHQSSPKMRGGILRSPSRSSKPSRPSSHNEPHNTRSL